MYADGQVVVQPLPAAIYGESSERTMPLRRLEAVLTEEELQEHSDKEMQKVCPMYIRIFLSGGWWSCSDRLSACDANGVLQRAKEEIAKEEAACMTVLSWQFTDSSVQWLRTGCICGGGGAFCCYHANACLKECRQVPCWQVSPCQCTNACYASHCAHSSRRAEWQTVVCMACSGTKHLDS